MSQRFTPAHSCSLRLAISRSFVFDRMAPTKRQGVRDAGCRGERQQVSSADLDRQWRSSARVTLVRRRLALLQVDSHQSAAPVDHARESLRVHDRARQGRHRAPIREQGQLARSSLSRTSCSLVRSFVLSIGRSLLHQQSTPRYTYDYKYKSGGRALGAKEIALYGRQVLEALSYLEHIGFPYPHLHSGNVILNDKKVCMYVHAHPCRGLRTAALIPCATRSVQAVGGREHVARSGAVLLSRVECQARGRVLRTLAVRVGSWRFEYVLRAHDATR